MKSVPFLASVVFVVSACTSLQMESKKIDYKSTTTVKTPSLEIPPDLTSPSRDGRFTVPEAAGKGTATFSTYSSERTPEQQAARSAVLPVVEKMRVERFGDQRWLVITETPDKLWDRIKDFWRETGFQINLERPEAGVMETDWAENRAKIQGDFLRNLLGKVIDSLYSTSERDKFRTRLEPGTLPGVTEVFISHRGVQELFVSEGREQTKWQPRKADPELEAEMLYRLMAFLGEDQKRVEAELLSSKQKTPDLVKLTQDKDGSGMLELPESFDRAWRRVGLALDRAGFTVEDRDRSRGVYFVRYIDSESESAKSENFFSRLLSFGKDSSRTPSTRFRILVKNEETLTRVSVLPAEGEEQKPNTPETTQKMLSLLFDQLK